MKYILVLILVVAPFKLFAAEIIRDAEVIEIANTKNNTQDFAIFIQGGTWTTTSSTCAITAPITFPESKSQSEASHQQAFSIALTALTTGKKVRIHNFEDDSCHGANFISISR